MMKLSRNLGLFSVTMIGVGAMIGAGIFILTGIAAGVAGPALILAFFLNGIVAFFTASAYAELGGSIPEAGGGYLWVKESLPQPTGFISGWMSWMAHSVACSLYAVGFSAYFAEVLEEFHIIIFLPQIVLRKVLAVAIVIIFTYINYRGAKETGKAGSIITILKIVILLGFIFLGSKIILLDEPHRFTHFTPFFGKGFTGILTAMGLTYIAFEGYEIIAQSGEEVKNPGKNIPKAIFLSLIIVVPIYILVAFIAIGAVDPGTMSPWDFLALKKETAMVEAARHISSWGAAILLIGGLLSTISALNATIYSSSRVSFAMGRDFNLPRIFSNIHKRFKTPNGSLLISAVLIIVMVLFFPVEDIASSADVMFLLLFVFVNIALIHIRRKSPERIKGYKSPFFPLFPVLGIITQTVLIIVMFFYSTKSFYTSLIWIGIGLSIYYGYSRLKEKSEVGPQVIFEAKELARKEFKLVVAIDEKKEVEPLMNIALPMAKENDAEIIATHVISLPPQTPLNTGKRFIEKRKEFLRYAYEMGEKAKVPVSFNIRVSHKIHNGLLESVIENKSNLMILGSGDIKPKAKIGTHVLDPLLQETPCDIGIMKIDGASKIKKILIPTSGGINAKLAFKLGTWIAKQNNGKITLLYIIPDKTNHEKAHHWLEETKKDVPYDKSIVEDAIVEGENILKTILNQSETHDIILIGASKESFLKKIRFGTIPDKLIRKSNIPVLVTRKYEGTLLSWVRRFIAGL